MEKLKKKYTHESQGLKNGYTMSRMEKSEFSNPLGFLGPGENIWASQAPPQS